MTHSTRRAIAISAALLSRALGSSASTQLLASPGSPWPAAPLTCVLSMPDTASGGPGSVVQVPISADQGTGVFGIDMTLEYNASVLTAQNVTVTGIASTFGIAANLNTPGTIVVSMYSTGSAMSGSGEIALVQFQVVGALSATSQLDIVSASANEGGIETPLDDGLFTVNCATGPAEITNVKPGSDHSTITWNSGGSGVLHDVARGLTTQLPVGGGVAETCFASGISTATVSDPSTPPLSNSYWYLVRARSACGAGTYGFRGNHGTPGSERVTSTCP